MNCGLDRPLMVFDVNYVDIFAKRRKKHIGVDAAYSDDTDARIVPVISMDMQWYCFKPVVLLFKF